jgi:hypothetical protein
VPATLPVPAAAPWSFRAAVPATRQPGRLLGIYLCPLIVAAAGTFLAALAYGRFVEVARHLWTSGIHDRNAHYWLGLSFALDFRHGDLLHMLHDVHAARVWGPLHPLLVGAVLAIGGVDYRLAVLPSLAAWVGTAVFAFLAARRAVARGGNLAGLTAAVFVLASPAHQAFATDIMLESLGACLTLAALYFALVAVQERSPRAGRLLGLALTALFFHKYNYWLVVALPLAAVALASQQRSSLRQAAGFVTGIRWREWLKAQLRHPLTYLLVPVLGMLAHVGWRGGGTLHIGGQRISLNTPYNLVHAAFVLLVLRLWPWWWRRGRALVRRLDAPARQLVYWHAWPVILWFLWPQRLGHFLWYLTRDHGHEQGTQGLAAGLAYYWNHMGTDYHRGSASLLIAGMLAGIAFLAWRRLRPGGAILLALALLAALMTFHHPTHRSRFLHSWIAAGWVAAGIGVAQVVYGWFISRWQAIRPWLGAGALMGLLGLHFPGVLQAGHAPEGGPQAGRPSVLELTDAYLPALDTAQRPAVFANLPLKFLTGWTLMERHGRHVDVESELRGFGASPAEDRRCLEHWLRTTRCDAVVVLSLAPGSPFYEPVPFPDYRQVHAVLTGHTGFAPGVHLPLAEYGCEVEVWKRTSAPADR